MTTRNRMTDIQKFKVMSWLEANAELVSTQPLDKVASIVTDIVDFEVGEKTIGRLCREMGIERSYRASPIKVKAEDVSFLANMLLDAINASLPLHMDPSDMNRLARIAGHGQEAA